MSSVVSPETVERLCGNCGMCCSGVLFIDVKMQDAQESLTLLKQGVELEQHEDVHYLVQPCSCLGEGNHCHIYPQRPKLCAAFECSLLSELKTGQRDESECNEIIEATREKVHALNDILMKLGNKETDVPLFLRTEETLSQPWDLSASDAINELRNQLFKHAAELTASIDQQFLGTRQTTE
jgi:uncharacterized protein